MLGDARWRELLAVRYDQHIADSSRHDRIPKPFEEWAVAATWLDFVRQVALLRSIPPVVARSRSVVVVGSESGYEAVDLSRRVTSALMLVKALLCEMRKEDRRLLYATVAYLDRRRKSPLLPRAQRWVYDWLCRAAERDR